MGEIWQEIWNTDLDREYSFDFEVYGDLENMESQLIEVYVALK